jgi:hypothetical protein
VTKAWFVAASTYRTIIINAKLSCFSGKLHFTNVKISDMVGGRAYSCMAINYFMRDNVTGPEHVVIVLGCMLLYFQESLDDN